LSINISPLQFQSKNHLNQLLRCANQKALACCVIEITEGLLMAAEAHVLQQLAQLQQAGIAVALDDFGTGYSSLSYLKKFPIDYIKIDQSFIKELPNSNHDQALCEAIIVMAKKMKIQVIAEGIETLEQYQLLKQMGCDYTQGYYHAKPLPAQALVQWVRQNNSIAQTLDHRLKQA